MKQALTLIVLAAAAAAAAAPAATAATPAAGSSAKGRVIKVEQHVRAANGGEYVRLTIETRQGEEMRLNVGKQGGPGECEGCYQVGDKVRARLGEASGSGGERCVESMKVRRGGQMFGLSQRDGTMRRARANGRAGNDAIHQRDRDRDRDHRPSRASSPGGSGSGGGRGRGGV